MTHASRSLMALVLAALLAPAATAAVPGATLVADLEHGASGRPHGFVAYNGVTLFAATDAAHGTELWTYNPVGGGAATLVADVWPGTSSADPSALTVAGGYVYFIAQTATGPALYRTAGDAASTVLVKAAPTGSTFGSACGSGTIAYFMEYRSDDGTRNIWKTDGTPAGTTLVSAQKFPGAIAPPFTDERRLFATPTCTIVLQSTAAAGVEVYAIDAASGLVKIATVAPAPATAIDYSYRSAVIAGKLVFVVTVSQAANAYELWATDGTAVGTQRLQQVWPAGLYSSKSRTYFHGLTIATVNGTAVATHGLWVTDGTPSGTKTVLTGIEPAAVGPLGENGALYTLNMAASLWRFDGTSSTRVAFSGSGVAEMFPLGGRLLFNASATVGGVAKVYLFCSDGTDAGTAPIFPTPAMAGQFQAGVAVDTPGGAIEVFNNGTLWSTDGTAAGTRQASVIGTDPGSVVSSFSTFGGKVLFNVEQNCSSGSAGMWSTDGTEAGTGFVTAKRSPSSGGNDVPYAVLGGRAYFAAPDSTGTSRLWSTDGTAAGTTTWRNVLSPTGIVAKAATDPLLLFQGQVPWGPYLQFTSAVWAVPASYVADTSKSPIRMRWDFTYTWVAMNDTAPDHFAAIGDKALMVAQETNGPGVYPLTLSDYASQDLSQVPVGSTTVCAASDRIYFAGTTRTGDHIVGYQLPGEIPRFDSYWLRDPHQVYKGSGPSTPSALTLVGNRLFFADGASLCVYDPATNAATRLTTATGASGPSALTPMGSKLVFAMSSLNEGVEPWVSDGTVAGTFRLADIAAGTASGFTQPIGIVAANGWAFFSGGPAGAVPSLWATDGTVANTGVVPGTETSTPQHLAVAAGRVYFTCDDHVHGREPWRVLSSLVPNVTVQMPSITQGTERGVSSFAITLTLDSPTDIGVEIPFTVDGTASDGSDYSIWPPSPVQFGPGMSSQQILVTIVDDQRYEADETIGIHLKTPTNGRLVGATDFTYTIVNDDPVPTVQFAQAVAQGSEALSPAVLPLKLSQLNGLPITLHLSIGGTATRGTAAGAGVDYVLASTDVVIAADDPAPAIRLPVVDDTAREPDETIVVTITGAVGATLAGGTPAPVLTCTYTIRDDDPPVDIEFSRATSSAPETQNASFTVVATGDFVGTLSVPYTLDGTAVSKATLPAGSTSPYNYTAPVSGTLTFSPTQRTQTITLGVFNNDAVEGARTVVATVATPSANALWTRGPIDVATHTILDDDALPVARFASTAGSIVEADATVAVTVTLDHAVNHPVRVPYAVSGTASAGSDYVLAPGEVVFAALATSATIPLQIVGDAASPAIEDNESVVITLGTPTTHPVEALLAAPATYTETILDAEDPRKAATISFAQATSSVAENGARLGVLVAATGLPAGSAELTVDVAVAGSAQDADRSVGPTHLRLSAAAPSATVWVTPLDDAISDGTRTVSLTLGQPSAGRLGAITTHVVTITDNEGPALPAVSFDTAASSVQETDTAPTAVRITATPAPTAPIRVSVSATPGTASATDFLLAQAYVDLTPTAPSAIVQIHAVDDAVAEGAETVVLALQVPTTAKAGAITRHTMTIVDDDGVAATPPAAPQFDPPSGRYFAPLTVAIRPQPTQAQVWYTSGTAPADPQPGQAGTTRYAGPLTITGPTTIKARGRLATASSVTDGPVATATYEILDPGSVVAVGGNTVQWSVASPASVEASAPLTDATCEASAWIDGRLFASPAAIPLSDGGFYADVPLQPDVEVEARLSVVDRRGGVATTAKRVRWQVTDIGKQSGTVIALRRGDQLLVAMSGSGSLATIDPGNLPSGQPAFRAAPGAPVVVGYPQAGNFTLSGSIDGQTAKTCTIHVYEVRIPADESIAAQVDFARPYAVDVAPAYVPAEMDFYSADPSALIVGKGAAAAAAAATTVVRTAGYDAELRAAAAAVAATTVNLTLQPKRRGRGVFTARLGGAGGPILAAKRVDEFTIDVAYAQCNGRAPYSGVAIVRPFVPVTLGVYGYEPIAAEFDDATGEHVGVLAIVPVLGTSQFDVPDLHQRSVKSGDVRVTTTGRMTGNVYAAKLVFSDPSFTSWVHADVTADLDHDGWLNYAAPTLSLAVSLAPPNDAIARHLRLTRAVDVADYVAGKPPVYPGQRLSSGSVPQAAPIALGPGSSWTISTMPAAQFVDVGGFSADYGIQVAYATTSSSAGATIQRAGPTGMPESGLSYIPTCQIAVTANNITKTGKSQLIAPEISVTADASGSVACRAMSSGCPAKWTSLWVQDGLTLAGDPFPTTTFAGQPVNFLLPIGSHSVNGAVMHVNYDGAYGAGGMVIVKVNGTSVAFAGGPAGKGDISWNTELDWRYANPTYLGRTGTRIDYRLMSGLGTMRIPIYVHTYPATPVQVTLTRDQTRVPIYRDEACTQPLLTGTALSANLTVGTDGTMQFVYAVFATDDEMQLDIAGNGSTARLDLISLTEVPGPATAGRPHVPVVPGYGTCSPLTGNLYLGFPIRSFHRAGLSPDVVLSYNGRDRLSAGRGLGWRTNYDMRVYASFDPDTPDAYVRQNRYFALVTETGARAISHGNGDPTHGAEVGADEYRVSEADAPVGRLLVRRTMRAGAPYPAIADWRDGERYRYSRGDGRRWYFDRDGWLLRIGAIDGENLTITRDASHAATAVQRDQETSVSISALVGAPGAAPAAISGGEAGHWKFDPGSVAGDLAAIHAVGDGVGLNGAFSLVGGATEQVWTLTLDPRTKAVTKVDGGALDAGRAVTTFANGVVTAPDGAITSWTSSGFTDAAGLRHELLGEVRVERSAIIGSDLSEHDLVWTEYDSDGYPVARTASPMPGVQTKTRFTWSALGTTEALADTRVLVERRDLAVRGTVDDGGSGEDLTTSFAYETGGGKAGRLARVTDACGGVTATDYSDDGIVLGVHDARHALWTIAGTTGTSGFPTSIASPERRTTTAVVDPTNGVSSGGTDALGFATSLTRDQLQRVIGVTAPGGVKTIADYDPLGRPTHTKDAVGREVRLTYDVLGRLRRVDAVAAVGEDGVTTTALDPETWSYASESFKPPGAASAIPCVRIVHKRGALILDEELRDGLGRVQERVDRHRLKITDAAPTAFATTCTYDPAFGDLVGIKDALGKITAVARSATADGALAITTTAPSGRTTTREYNALGWLLADVDGAGARTQHVYDACGRHVRTVNALGGWSQSGYDLAGAAVSSGASVGKPEFRVLDHDGVDAGSIDRFGTHVDHRVVPGAPVRDVTSVVGGGIEATTAYDGRALPISTTTTLSGAVAQTSVTVRNDGSTRAVTPPALGQATTSVDGFGRPWQQRQIVDAAGATLTGTTAFAASGLPAKAVSPDGLVTAPSFDAITGEPIRTQTNASATAASPTALADAQAVLERDALGRPLAVGVFTGAADETAALPQLVSRTWYDDDGRVAKSQTPDGVSTTYDYDGASRVSKVTVTSTDATPQKLTTTIAYDAIGDAVRVVDAAGGVRTRSYDAIGRLLSDTVAGETTAYVYDGDTLFLREVRAPGGRTTKYEPDERGRVGAVTDPDGYTTRYRYDDLGRVRVITYADGKTERIDYVADSGRVDTRVDRQGRTTTYAYDLAGRPTGVSVIGSGVTASATHTYAPVNAVGVPFGHTETATMAGQSIVRSFDQAGRLVSFAQDSTPFAFAYDRAGRLKTRGPQAYVYKPSGQLDTLTAFGQAIQFGYDGYGRLTSTTLGSTGVSRTATLDGVGRITAMTQRWDAALQAENWSLRRDPAGRIEHLELTAPTPPLEPAFAVDYRYDAAGRVIGETRSGADPIELLYGYDANDNRTLTVAMTGVQSMTQPFTGTVVPPQLGALASGWTLPGTVLQAKGLGTLRQPLNLGAGSTLSSLGGEVAVALNPSMTGSTNANDVLSAGIAITTSGTEYRALWQTKQGGMGSLGPIYIGRVVIQKVVAGVATDGPASGWIADTGYSQPKRLVLSLEPGERVRVRVDTSDGIAATDGVCAGIGTPTPTALALCTTSTSTVALATTFDDLQWSLGTGRTVTTAQFDALSRLASETIVSNGSTVAQTTSSYYDWGGLSARTRTGTGASTVTYQYDGFDRLASCGNGVGTVATFDYLADTWLRRSATNGGSTTTFRADGSSIVSATAAAGTAGAATTDFALLGSTPLLQRTASGVGALLIGPMGDVTGISRLVASPDPDAGKYRPTQLFAYDAYGNVVERARQVVGGVPSYAVVSPTNGPRYRGMWFDAGNVGLYKTQTRSYDPSVGRFTSIDPARAGTNWYAYCRGDPANRVDTMGLWWKMSYQIEGEGDGAPDFTINHDGVTIEARWVAEPGLPTAPDRQQWQTTLQSRAAAIDQRLTETKDGFVREDAEFAVADAFTPSDIIRGIWDGDAAARYLQRHARRDAAFFAALRAASPEEVHAMVRNSLLFGAAAPPAVAAAVVAAPGAVTYATSVAAAYAPEAAAFAFSSGGQATVAIGTVGAISYAATGDPRQAAADVAMTWLGMGAPGANRVWPTRSPAPARLNSPRLYFTTEDSPRHPESVVLTRSTSPGRYAYAVSEGGQIRVVPDPGGHVHPSILGGGRPVIGAGELEIAPGGIVTEVNNISGSFRPSADSLALVLRLLRLQGLRISQDAVQPFDHPDCVVPWLRPLSPGWIDQIGNPTGR